MKRRERYIESLDEVIITRDGDYALIAYKEKGVGATHLQIGPEIVETSDTEILELHNGCLRAQAKRAAGYKHVAVEVSLGSAQIECDARCDQWVPRGGVLRCLIHDEELQLVVSFRAALSLRTGRRKLWGEETGPIGKLERGCLCRIAPRSLCPVLRRAESVYDRHLLRLRTLAGSCTGNVSQMP